MNLKPMKSIGDKEKRRLRAIAIIKSSIIEAYDDTEKEATLFATGLVQKFADEQHGDIILGHHNDGDGRLEAYLVG